MVIGGIGSISGSVIATFLYVACSEWWLRVLDSQVVLQDSAAKLEFAVVFAVAILAVMGLVFWRQMRKGKKLFSSTHVCGKRKLQVNWAFLALLVVGVAGLVWDGAFLLGNNMTLPLVRNGFRMVVFSVLLLVVIIVSSQLYKLKI